MNILSHLVLAGSDPDIQIGQFLGDFTRGSVDQLPYAERILTGIRAHRRIDAAGERHEFLRQARCFVPPETRRYTGIVMDVLGDWLLYRHWDSLMTESQQEVCDRLNRLLSQPHPDWPPGAQRFARLVVDHDLLAGYEDLEVIRDTLRRMSNRLHKPVPLHHLLPPLLEQQAWLDTHFPDYFNDMKKQSLLITDPGLSG